MSSFQTHSYDTTPDSLTGLLRSLARDRGSAADIVVTLEAMPAGAVDVAYHWPRTIAVGLPDAPPLDDSFVHRFLCAWILFVAVKLRFPEVSGRCRLWLDDIPSHSGLAFCGNSTGQTLIPDPVFLESKGYLFLRQQAAAHVPPWRERHRQVFWRGASTGSRHHLGVSAWRDLPRLRLCLMTREWGRDELFDVGLSSVVQVWQEQELVEINAAGILRPGVSQEDFGRFRHGIDIDGNSSSWPGLFSKLVLGITVLKVASPLGYRQWYYDELRPWKNFVPVAADLSDLLEAAEWLQGHPAEAEAIAAAGRDLAERLSFEAVVDDAAARIRAILR